MVSCGLVCWQRGSPDVIFMWGERLKNRNGKLWGNGRLIFSSLSAVNLRGLPCSMRQAGGDHCAHVTDGHTEAPRCTANTPKHRAWVSPELCFFTAPAGTQAHGEEEEETGAGWQVLGMLLRNPEHCPGDVICLLPTGFPPFFVGTVWGKIRGT